MDWDCGRAVASCLLILPSCTFTPLVLRWQLAHALSLTPHSLRTTPPNDATLRRATPRATRPQPTTSPWLASAARLGSQRRGTIWVSRSNERQSDRAAAARLQRFTGRYRPTTAAHGSGLRSAGLSSGARK